MPYIAFDPAEAQAAPATTIGIPRTSGTMSFAVMVAELRARLLGRVDVSPERLQLYTNLAYVDLCTSLILPGSRGSLALDLVAEQNMYLLPEVVYAIEGAALDLDEDAPLGARGKPLELTSVDRFRRAVLKDGWPEEFFHYDRMLVIYPTPEEASGRVVIDFIVQPIYMVQDTDFHILGRAWDEGILLKAEQKVLEAVDEHEAAGLAENAYLSFVRKRLDPAAVEDGGKVMKSSVPLDMLSNSRRRKAKVWLDGMD